MDQEESIRRFLVKKRRLKRHLSKMKSALPNAMEQAFDRYYETEGLTYLSIEEKLFRFESLIAKLDEEIEESDCVSKLRQAAGRVNYISDQLDAVEAKLYRRGRRRSRFPFNLSDFFNAATGQNKNGPFSSWNEVSSISEAYQVLELDESCDFSQVTTSFRKMAKKYHPDARGGDRSDEKQLRRVVEAYRIIREHLGHA